MFSINSLLNSFQRIGNDSLALPLVSIIKSLPIKSVVYFILSIFLLFPFTIYAEIKIGYVVVEKVLKDAPQTASSNKKLEKEFKYRTDGLQKTEKALQDQEKDLKKSVRSALDGINKAAEFQASIAGRTRDALIDTNKILQQEQDLAKNILSLESNKSDLIRKAKQQKQDYASI